MDFKKTALRLSAFAIFSFLKLTLAGWTLCLVGIISSWSQLHLGIGEGKEKWISFFLDKCGVNLLFIACIVAVVLYVIIVVKYVIKKLIFNEYLDKIDHFIESKIEHYVTEIVEHQPEWLTTKVNSAKAKLAFMDRFQKDSTIDRFQQKILEVVLSQLNLEDIDFKNPEKIKLSREISSRVTVKINETLKPSLLEYWILSGILFAWTLLVQFLAS